MIRCDGVATVVDGDSKQNTLGFFFMCFVLLLSQMSEFTIGPLRIMKDPLKRRHMIVGSDLACASPKLLR